MPQARRADNRAAPSGRIERDTTPPPFLEPKVASYWDAPQWGLNPRAEIRVKRPLTYVELPFRYGNCRQTVCRDRVCGLRSTVARPVRGPAGTPDDEVRRPNPASSVSCRSNVIQP